MNFDYQKALQRAIDAVKAERPSRGFARVWPWRRPDLRQLATLAVVATVDSIAEDEQSRLAAESIYDGPAPSAAEKALRAIRLGDSWDAWDALEASLALADPNYEPTAGKDRALRPIRYRAGGYDRLAIAVFLYAGYMEDRGPGLSLPPIARFIHEQLPAGARRLLADIANADHDPERACGWRALDGKLTVTHPMIAELCIDLAALSPTHLDAMLAAFAADLLPYRLISYKWYPSRLRPTPVDDTDHAAGVGRSLRSIRTGTQFEVQDALEFANGILDEIHMGSNDSFWKGLALKPLAALALHACFQADAAQAAAPSSQPLDIAKDIARAAESRLGGWTPPAPSRSLAWLVELAVGGDIAKLFHDMSIAHHDPAGVRRWRDERQAVVVTHPFIAKVAAEMLRTEPDERAKAMSTISSALVHASRGERERSRPA